LAAAADREQRLLDDAKQARELEAQREQCAREQLLADVQRQRDREAQREIDMRRDFYDLSRQSSRAAALEAELKCLKANMGPSTVAYEIIDVPVQPDDTAPPEATTAVHMSPLRPTTPVTSIDNTAHALTWRSRDADNCHGADISMSQSPYLSFATSELTECRTVVTSERTHTPITFSRLQPQLTDPGYMRRQYDTPPRLPAAAAITDHAYTHTLPRHPGTRAIASDSLHAFSRYMEPPCTQSAMTSALPCQQVYPPCDDVMISALPRPPSLVHPPYREDVVTSALPHPPTAPADFAMQRHRVVDCNVYTHGIEQLLLPELPQPPPVHRQMPLLSDNKQTTASDYVNQDPVPVLTAHRYADIPFDSINYQNISPNLSLPTHDNVPTHICVSLSQPIALGQSNVTQPSALYAASYTSNPSSMVAFQSSVCTSQADNSQRLPIAVGQPALSAFSRVDAPKNRPIAVDPTVQYTVGTSVSSSSAPLQSPSVHWRKRLAYDYVQPDTGLGALIHAAPAIHSGYIRPQISDTHTDTHTNVHLQTVSF